MPSVLDGEVMALSGQTAAVVAARMTGKVGAVLPAHSFDNTIVIALIVFMGLGDEAIWASVLGGAHG